MLEELLGKFSVPMAYIDGHSVIKLAERAELERPTGEQLLECIANVDQVGSLLRIPGRRFTKDDGGKNRASLCVSLLFCFAQLFSYCCCCCCCC